MQLACLKQLPAWHVKWRYRYGSVVLIICITIFVEKIADVCFCIYVIIYLQKTGPRFIQIIIWLLHKAVVKYLNYDESSLIIPGSQDKSRNEMLWNLLTERRPPM